MKPVYCAQIGSLAAELIMACHWTRDMNNRRLKVLAQNMISLYT